METVQLQCGSCNKLMAISTAHLGGQVRCPHCQAVVQAPPRPQVANAPAPLEILPPRVEAGEVESIFSPAEPSEDLFDRGPQRPLVEMPEVRTSAPAPAAVDNNVTVEAPRPVFHETTELLSGPPPAEAPATEGDPDLATFKRPPRPVDRGYVSLMLLIFLVPYSIMMTLFVIYLWYQAANQTNNLDLMPDPVPKKDGGGARTVLRAAHDQPLVAHQKVPLNGTVRIGEIEVTPRKVVRDSLGDLELTLQVRNVSANQAFSPMHPDFLKTTKGGALPYTFIQSTTFARLYGGHLAFIRSDDEKTSEGDLLPGQAESVVITTRDNKPVVEQILKRPDEHLTWRVQLRRGLVPYRGQKVSTTAVIGVVFSAKDIGNSG